MPASPAALAEHHQVHFASLVTGLNQRCPAAEILPLPACFRSAEATHLKLAEFINRIWG